MIRPLLAVLAIFTLLRIQSLALGASENIEQAWDVVWSRFYLPRVQTFGDYLSTYEEGKEQAHLPTAAEVKRQYPNPIPKTCA